MVLSALASSNSLPTITHIRCGGNRSWFSQGKESNMELFIDAIRAMKNLRYLDLSDSNFSTEVCDKVISAIVEIQEQNNNLSDIHLFSIGSQFDLNFSSSTKEHVAALRAKGLTIAQTKEESKEMDKRFHGGKWR